MNFRNSSFRNSRFRNSRISISFCSRNSRIPYYVILRLELRISIWNSRILCDETLGVKSGDDTRLRNSRFMNSRIPISFYSRNSRIPYYVILGLELRISIWNSRILCDESLGSSRGITQGRSG